MDEEVGSGGGIRGVYNELRKKKRHFSGVGRCREFLYKKIRCTLMYTSDCELETLSEEGGAKVNIKSRAIILGKFFTYLRLKISKNLADSSEPLTVLS